MCLDERAKREEKEEKEQREHSVITDAEKTETLASENCRKRKALEEKRIGNACITYSYC